MFGEMPEHIRKRHEKDIPSLGDLDDVRIPSSAPIEGIVMAPERLEARDALLDNSAKLEDLTEKALDFYHDVLSEPMDIDNGKLLSAQQDAARTIMTTQLRVDDSRLKKRSVDTLAKLLARMSEEEGKLMKVVSA